MKSARTEIFDHLREIQDQYGYLPADQLRTLSDRTGTPLFRIHGVADVAIKKVSCLGQCDGAPAVSITGLGGDHFYRGVTGAQAEALVTAALNGRQLPEMCADEQLTGLPPDPYPDGQRYGALRKLIASKY